MGQPAPFAAGFSRGALARHPAIHRWHDRPFQGRQSHPPRRVDQRRATRGPAAVRRRRENPDRHADLSFLRHRHGTVARALLPRHAFDLAALSSRGYAAHDRRAPHYVVRGKPDIVRRPDGARGVRHDEFRKPRPLLLRFVGTADGNHAPLGSRDRLHHLRGLRPKRSRPGADLQSA